MLLRSRILDTEDDARHAGYASVSQHAVGHRLPRHTIAISHDTF